MEKQSGSRSAFFNPRVLVGFALYSIGVLLVLVGLSKFVTGMSAMTGTANPVPLINEPLVPDAIAPGGAGFTLTVNGTGFVLGSVVNWNGNARATTFVSNSQLTASILASDIAIASTASATVVNPSPGGGISNVIFFPVTNSTLSVGMESSVIGTSSAETATAGDFNGDGKPDLAVAGRFSSRVSILLGNGDGSFQPRADYEVGLFARWVITGDFNGDGKLDLACGGDVSAQVSILLGSGDGTFQAPMLFATGAAPIWGVTADFNRDGKLDLAVAGSGEVSILLGNGDGSLGGHLDYDVGEGYMWVDAGDFNGDGTLDLAIGQWAAPNVFILLGNGDGTFQPHVDYPTGTNPRSLAVGDLNGDGELDLAVADDSSSQVSILLGNGDGTFQSHVDYAAVIAPTWISLGDFNGDGTLDLALSSFAAPRTQAVILLGNGDGTFQRPLRYPTHGGRGESGTVADFDGNGRLDLAIANSDSSTVSILLQSKSSYRDMILADIPMMYWRLGEPCKRIAHDKSANHRDATYIHQPFLGLHGAIANDTNTSVGLNGCNQWVGWIPTSSYSGVFTVEGWVKEKKVHLVETFFNTRTKTAEFSFDFKFDTLAGKEIRFDVGDGIQWLSTSGVPFDFKRNVWYYVGAVVTTTGATYYVDGSAIGSVTYSGTPLLFDPAHVVQIGTNTRYDSEWFDGAIDEVAVYDYALTADQIAAHYATGIGN